MMIRMTGGEVLPLATTGTRLTAKSNKMLEMELELEDGGYWRRYWRRYWSRYWSRKMEGTGDGTGVGRWRVLETELEMEAGTGDGSRSGTGDGTGAGGWRVLETELDVRHGSF